MKTFHHKKRAQEIINVNYRLCFGLAKKNMRDKIHQMKGSFTLGQFTKHKFKMGQLPVILFGFMYVFKKMMTNYVCSWRFILRRKEAQCKATIKLLIPDESIGQNNEHAHPLSQMEVEAIKTKASIKQKAEATEEISQQILASEVRNIPLQISLPSLLSRRPPSFALDLWNMFNRADGELPRTNLSTNVIIMSDSEKSDLCSNLSVSVIYQIFYEISSMLNDLCIIRRGVISMKAMLLLWCFYQCLCFLHI